MGTYLGDVWRCRYFWLSLVRLDLRNRYRRSVLGVGWSLVHPLAMTAILCLVFHKLFHQDVRDYGPYLLAGLATWNYIVSVSMQGCQCFFQGESYIRQYPAPLAIYPLRTALGATVHFLVALLVVVVLSVAFRGPGSLAGVLSLLPTVGLLFLLGWSLAVLAGIVNVLFQDTQHIAEVGFQMLFYATPILYKPQQLESHSLAWVVRMNPLVPFLELIRQPVLEGQLPSAATFAAALATVCVTTGVAGLLLSCFQRRLIFYL
jgi:lipopolysaccharide transport system permease protein